MLAIWIELSEYSENFVIHFLITNRTGCLYILEGWRGE